MTPSPAAATMEDVQKSAAGLRVAIVGAGVSGLATCKHFSQQGLNATVFEGKSGLGGVWRSSYSSTKLQTPKGSYQFSDFPWPADMPTFPSHHQVVDYLESYARHFRFMDRIRFNSQVVEVRKKMKLDVSLELGTPNFPEHGWVREGGRGGQFMESFITKAEKGEPGESNADHFSWEVCVRTKVPGSDGTAEYIDEWLTFDYLVMCCGQYGDVAKLPSFPVSHGPDVFDGQVLHSLHYSALDSQSAREFLSGKKVVVVGFQKTSLDIAVEVADINQRVDKGQPCTMVFRRTHWIYPRHRRAFGLFPFGYLFGTRLSGYWTPKPGQGFLQCVLQSIFSPVRWLVWKMLEYYLRWTVPVGQFGLVPEHSLFEDLSACILPQLPQDLLGHIQAGRIVPQKTPYWDFYAKGIHLADGTAIEADVVILCTGYDGQSKLKSILPEKYRYALFEPEGVLTLYRGTIHPQIPNMAFVGYHEGLSAVHSSEMGAVWLAQLLQRKFLLPDISIMEIDRRDWLRHLKITTPFYSRSCVATMQIWHTDKLCDDMRRKSLRKQTWWQEMFSVYNNSDYKLFSS